MSKKKFSQKPEPNLSGLKSPDDMLRYMLTMVLISAGGEVLQDAYGFTEEQAGAWAIETMARAKANLPQGLPAVA